ncbi:MAG: sigma-E processing peptidase SpoIIGA [Clostridia bacterium]|nr:sigma-E processing peptidase SpoIIGA [Clostridia bacterium]
MTVYVEYVFLDNLIIDCMLISLARKSLRIQTKRWGVIASALFGATVATVMPLFRLRATVGAIVKIPIGMAIVLLSGKFKSAGEYFKCFCLFLLFTFLFGGGATAVFWSLGLSFDPLNYSHGGEIPLFIILATASAIYLLCKRAVINFYRKKRAADFTFKCAVQIGGKAFVKTAFLDSGNGLTYKKTVPVAVCTQKFVGELEREGVLNKVYKDLIKINTVSGETVIPVYRAEKFLIYNSGKMNILDNVMIGVPKRDMLLSEDFDLLIGPIAMEGAEC